MNLVFVQGLFKKRVTNRQFSRVVAEEDKKALETIASSIIKEKQPFVRLEMTKAELLEMFKYSKYKEYFISQRVPDNTKSTVYRCGPLIDLCRGPHVPNTGNIKAFSVLKVSFIDIDIQTKQLTPIRTLPPTGLVTAKTSPSSELLVSHSPTRLLLPITRSSSRRLPSATTARLARTKSSSSLTRCHLVLRSGCLMAPVSTSL